MIRVLFIGDVVGRLGRATIGKILPRLKKERKIDLCIANGENLAGGRGLTRETISEVIGYGVDLLTGGDHTFWNKNFAYDINDFPVLRCINLKSNFPGYGFRELTVGSGPPAGGSIAVLVVSVLGAQSTFIREEGENPFVYLDRFLSQRSVRGEIVLIDFHAELTSEKVALGWFLDGRVAAVVGTHTHVPTGDQRILPQGTAYVTDLGMVGSSEGVLGVKKEIIIDRFVTGNPRSFEWVKGGRAVFNSLLVELDEKVGRAVSIERIDRVIEPEV